jgi:hypothetical protein
MPVKCAFCTQDADSVAYDRENKKIFHVCSIHKNMVADIGEPEYVVSCPNCGCEFGVN